MQGETLRRDALAQIQIERLSALLAEVSPRNRFYDRKFKEAGVVPASVSSLAELTRLPFTTKTELLADQADYPPYGQVLTYPRERYSRLHQTSGTSGRPLRWLDTKESWHRLLDCWDTMFRIAGVGASDRLFFPFSFGPFLGFWTAFEAAARQGWFCLAGGGLSTPARLRLVLDHEATVVLCTPTYALRLAEVARQEKIDLPASGVRMVIVAGEPGGSIPATRQRIEDSWGAKVFDHNGMTEVGPTGIECPDNPIGLHLVETDYIAEVIDPATTHAVPAGGLGELVLTNLHRLGSPVIRYRTGDQVRVDPRPCSCGRALIRLEGGILGRTDDMIHLRGNNFHPSSLEAVIYRFEEIAEYQVEIDRSAALAQLRVTVEPRSERDGTELAERLSRAIRDELLFRADVVAVSPGTLPRFEMKAQRVKIK